MFYRQPIIVELRNGCKFKVRSLMDVWIVKEACLDHDYESNSIEIKDGWTIIDVGAGIGEFAISVAKGHPSSQIYAYEPFPESFALLRENLNLNNTKNVKASQTAVGPSSGKMVLATTGEAVQHTTTHNVTPDSTTSLIEVDGLSLADLFYTNEITHCDFLKIDCEGCEFDVLLNTSRDVLEKIDHIILEYHNGFTPYSHTELARHLQENGFQVKITPNPVHNYLGFLYAHRP